MKKTLLLLTITIALLGIVLYSGQIAPTELANAQEGADVEVPFLGEVVDLAHDIMLVSTQRFVCHGLAQHENADFIALLHRP